jgi:putative flippase GtrA
MDKIEKLYNQLTAIKFVKFFLSGGLAFLIDTSILLAIKYLFFGGEDVQILGTVSIAKLISSTAGILFMFTLNRNWVFSENKNKRISIQGAKYIAVTITNLLIANLLFSFYLSELAYLATISSADTTTLGGAITAFANLLSELSKMFISFFAYKYLVFR